MNQIDHSREIGLVQSIVEEYRCCCKSVRLAEKIKKKGSIEVQTAKVGSTFVNFLRFIRFLPGLLYPAAE